MLTSLKTNGSMIEVSILDLKTLMLETAKLAVLEANAVAGKSKPYISKSEAYKRYGRRIVDGWVDRGDIKLIKDGNSSHNIRISVTELQAVASCSNRISFYQDKIKVNKNGRKIRQRKIKEISNHEQL